MLVEFVKSLIEDNYNLGEITEIHQIVGGVTNRSFGLTCEKNGVSTPYFCKQYFDTKTKDEIKYEHTVIAHLKHKAPEMFSVPVETRSGENYVEASYNGHNNFYSVFTYLYGEEPYDWRTCAMSPKASASFAKAVADFHIWGLDFIPPVDCSHPIDLFSHEMSRWKNEIPKLVEDIENEGRAVSYTRVFRKKMDYIMNLIDFTMPAAEKYEPSLPKCLIHYDMSPGNMKFDQDENVIGIFDLDWAGEGFRMRDVTFSIFNNYGTYDFDDFGAITLEDQRDFLTNYTNELQASGRDDLLFTNEEKAFYPYYLLIQGMMVCWDQLGLVHDHPEYNPYEFTYYTSKFLHSVIYLDNHFNEIRNMIQEL